MKPRKPASPTVKILFTCAGVLVAVYLSFLFHSYYQWVKKSAATAGKEDAGPPAIPVGTGGGMATGNTTNATKLAWQVATLMNTTRNQRYTKLEKQSFMDRALNQGGAISVRCEVYESGLLFMVQVPELRRFESSAQASLGNDAWEAVRESIADTTLRDQKFKLAVGLRGLVLYERVLLGTYSYAPKNGSMPAPEVIEGAGCENRMVEWLAPTGLRNVGDTPASSQKTNSEQIP